MRLRNATAAALAALCLIVGLAACGDDDDDGGDDTGGVPGGEVVAGTGYSYDLPEGWTDVGALGDSAPAAFREELTVVDTIATVDMEAEFASEVGVITAPVPEGTTLDQFARISKQSIADPATFPAGVTFDSPPTGPTPIELGGEDAMELGHDGSFRGDSTSGDYRQRQLLALHDGSAYVATLASYPVEPDAADTDEADFEQIIDSWQWAE